MVKPNLDETLASLEESERKADAEDPDALLRARERNLLTLSLAHTRRDRGFIEEEIVAVYRWAEGIKTRELVWELVEDGELVVRLGDEGEPVFNEAEGTSEGWEMDDPRLQPCLQEIETLSQQLQDVLEFRLRVDVGEDGAIVLLPLSAADGEG